MKKGFTLAEVLVAIAIIGVTAAITLPIINSVQPNRELVMLKKAYFNLNNTVSELVNDDDLYPETVDPTTSYLSNTVAVSFRGHNNLGGNTKFCELVAIKMGGDCANGTDFTDRDGMVWHIDRTDFDRGERALGTTDVTVDVNGNNRGNNCLDTAMVAVFGRPCEEPDQFQMTVNRMGRVDIGGLRGPLYVAEKNNTKKADEFGVHQQQQGPIIGPRRPPLNPNVPANQRPLELFNGGINQRQQ